MLQFQTFPLRNGAAVKCGSSIKSPSAQITTNWESSNKFPRLLKVKMNVHKTQNQI